MSPPLGYKLLTSSIVSFTLILCKGEKDLAHHMYSRICQIDGMMDGWRVQQERRLLQNTHQASNETAIVKNSLQPNKKDQGSPPDTHTQMTVRIISHIVQVNIEERLSDLVSNRRLWQKQSQQITQIKVKPGKILKLSLLITQSL